MTFDSDLLDKIKQNADIVNIISSYINLEKKSSSYWGVCPFHPDTNPSLSVSPEKKIWKCFTCGASGNVFTFVQKYLKIPFVEAVKIVAEKSGYKLADTKSDEKSILLKKYYNILNDAKDFYKFYLNNTVEGLKAKEYLKSRNITPEIEKHFDIGLSPDMFDGTYKALTNDNTYLSSDLVEVGLVRQNNDKNGYHDIFRKRIMFPINDIYGNVVGFSARLYEKSDKEAKYINSNDNVVFHKGNILYNYFNALNDIKMTETVYIFEGFMDVIAAYKVGLKNAVATMGTAITKFHINLLGKNAKKIVICYDGDNAGINASKKAITLLKSSNVDLKLILIPDGLDPDEYLIKYGKEKLIELFQRPLSVIDYLYELELRTLILDDISTCETFKKNIFKYMRYFSSNTLNEQLFKKMSLDLNVSLDSIKNDFSKNKSIDDDNYIKKQVKDVTLLFKKGSKKKKNCQDKKKYRKAEDEVIVFAYQSKENSEYVASLLSLGQCVDREKRNLLMKITDYYRDNDLLDEIGFFEKLTDNEKYIIDSLIKIAIPNKDEIEELVKTISEFTIAKKLDSTYNEIKETKSIDKLKEYIDCKKATTKFKK